MTSLARSRTGAVHFILLKTDKLALWNLNRRMIFIQNGHVAQLHSSPIAFKSKGKGPPVSPKTDSNSPKEQAPKPIAPQADKSKDTKTPPPLSNAKSTTAPSTTGITKPKIEKSKPELNPKVNNNSPKPQPKQNSIASSESKVEREKAPSPPPKTKPASQVPTPNLIPPNPKKTTDDCVRNLASTGSSSPSIPKSPEPTPSPASQPESSDVNAAKTEPPSSGLSELDKDSSSGSSSSSSSPASQPASSDSNVTKPETSISSEPEVSVPPDSTSASTTPPAAENSPSEAPSSSSSTPPKDQTVDPITKDEFYKDFRGKQTAGPVSFRAVALFLLTGAALIVYFRSEKERMDRVRMRIVIAF
jgi:hypothetical protein